MLYVKSLNAGVLHILGAPFSGPFEGEKDSHGHKFDPNKTDFMEDYIKFPPVFYKHGAMNKDKESRTSEVVGETVKRWMDNAGVWFEVHLDMTKQICIDAWEAAQDNKLYASTGTVPAAFDVDGAGIIKQWMIGDLSLIIWDGEKSNQPSNYYAIAKPADYVKFIDEDKQDAFNQLLELEVEPKPEELEVIKEQPINTDDEKETVKMSNEDLLQMIRTLTSTIFSAIENGSNMEEVELMIGESFVEFADAWDEDDETATENMEAVKTHVADVIKNIFGVSERSTEVVVSDLEEKATEIEDLTKEVGDLRSTIEKTADESWADEQDAQGKFVYEGEKEEVLEVIEEERHTAAMTKSTPTLRIKAMIEKRTAKPTTVRFMDLDTGSTDPAPTPEEEEKLLNSLMGV